MLRWLVAGLQVVALLLFALALRYQSWTLVYVNDRQSKSLQRIIFAPTLYCMEFKDKRNTSCHSYYDQRKLTDFGSESINTLPPHNGKTLRKNHNTVRLLWCRYREAESWFKQAIDRLTCLFFLESTAYTIFTLICLSVMTAIMAVLYALQRRFTKKIKKIFGLTWIFSSRFSKNVIKAKTLVCFCILCFSALTALAGCLVIVEWTIYTKQLLGKESTLGPSFYLIVFGTIMATSGFIVAIFYRMENVYRVKSHDLAPASRTDIPSIASSSISFHSGLLRTKSSSETVNPLNQPANYKM
ncbi:unnamed protein product [Albugo candida]|uniref:Uncharacterized protein n=1 Tax=Albugo candida TaxID=65357 RepID=A0A024GH81_9STRA|nr:unnamed protein product [Albugo candida]|eukprot:CCI45702.1 unnamed protein product [Albugo candida]